MRHRTACHQKARAQYRASQNNCRIATYPAPRASSILRVPRALLLFEPPDGGAPEVVLHLALGMESHGWEVAVAGPEQASIRPRLEEAAVEYLPMRDFTRGAHSPVAPLRALRHLHAQLAEDPCDVLHCHSSKAGVIGRMVGARRGIPVVYSPHCFAFLRDLGALL
jgi:Glycosyl transferase 4-like domain